MSRMRDRCGWSQDGLSNLAVFVNSNCRHRFLNNQTTTSYQGPGRPRGSVRIAWLKRLVGLLGRQHLKQTLPSCAMNDIATDVADSDPRNGQAILPRSLPAALKR